MKQKNQRTLIYIRYTAPLILMCCVLILALVPCYRYATGNSLEGAVSLFELSSNAVDTAREYLFSGRQTVAANVTFARTLIILVPCLWLLFLLGAASAIYSFTRFIRFARGDRHSRSQVLFLTICPNRAVLCIYHALMLPVLFLPRIMPLLYRTLLAYEVRLYCKPFDMLFVYLALFAAMLILIIISSRHEALRELNIYTKLRSAEPAEACQAEADYDEQEDEPDDPYELILKRAKDEQAQRILKLLNNNDENEDKNE